MLCLIADEKTLTNYGLTDGAKLFLVVKKSESPLSIPQPKPVPDLWTQLEALLLKHFSQQNAEKVMEEFRKVGRRSCTGGEGRGV